MDRVSPYDDGLRRYNLGILGSSLSPPARLIAICLWRYSSKDGKGCRMGMLSLCRDSGYSENTVRKAVQEVIDKGWATRSKRANNGFLYVLLPPAVSAVGNLSICGSETAASEGDGRMMMEGEDGTPHAPRGVRVPWDDIQRQWNELADRLGISKIAILDESRKKTFRRRLVDRGPDFWERVLEEVAQLNDWALGSDGWRLDFDYCLQVKGSRKLLEGGWRKDQPKTEQKYKSLAQQNREKKAKREREQQW